MTNSSKPSYKIYKVEVKKVLPITPMMRRLTLDASGVPGLRADRPGQWVKIFVRDEVDNLQPGRAYTVRNLNETTGEIDVDFFLHNPSGPLSTWAALTKAGEFCEISSPHRSSGIVIAEQSTKYFLAADDTGLPAIFSILENLPENATAKVLIEVENEAEKQPIKSLAKIDAQWLYRASDNYSGLSEAILSNIPPTPCEVFIAAESSDIKKIKSHLSDRPDFRSMDLSGYWKRGEKDYRDE